MISSLTQHWWCRRTSNTEGAWIQLFPPCMVLGKIKCCLRHFRFAKRRTCVLKKTQKFTIPELIPILSCICRLPNSMKVLIFIIFTKARAKSAISHAWRSLLRLGKPEKETKRPVIYYDAIKCYQTYKCLQTSSKIRQDIHYLTLSCTSRW